MSPQPKSRVMPVFWASYLIAVAVVLWLGWLAAHGTPRVDARVGVSEWRVG